MRRRGLLVLPALAGCASAPVAPLQQAPASLLDGPLPAGGRLWRLVAAASLLQIVAFRGGAAPKLGHHHLLRAPQAQGALWLPEDGVAGAQGELRVRLAELVLDEPAWRREAGGEFDEKPVDEAARAATRRNLLSPQGLDAAAHPEVRLHLNAVTGALPWLIGTLGVSLAGQHRQQRLALRLQREGERLRLQARAVLSQRAHGREPFSILGGLLAMQDEVLLEADLVLQ